MSRPTFVVSFFVITSIFTTKAHAQSDGIVALKSDDAVLRLRPVLQADGRFFLEGGKNTFLARRIRPALEATIHDRFDLRITPELAQPSPSVVDAWANVRIVKELQLRFGKMKAPVGLERNQADQDLNFVERGLANELVPDRDVGAMIWGELFEGTIVYQGGVFDGAFDGKQIDVDTNEQKDVDGRVLVRPFAATSIAFLKELTIGAAGTIGQHDGVQPGATTLPGYVTAGQSTFFAWNADVFAQGKEKRFVPQASWYVGPFGAWAELAFVHQAVARNPATGGAFSTGANQQAYTVTIAGVLTGEDATYGTLRPNRVFDPEKGAWGAIELDARVSGLHADAIVFGHEGLVGTNVADASTSARRAFEWAIGAQWHFAPGIKMVLDYFQTTLEGGAASGADRPSEKVFVGRFQIAY